MGMDKYAVVEGTSQQGLNKQAEAECGDCGGTLEKHGSVTICANCGSKPFEESETQCPARRKPR